MSKVSLEQSGMRLDAFLAQSLDISRGKVKLAVEEGACTVDGELCAQPTKRVQEGQEVILSLPGEASTLQAEEGEVVIVYQDEALAVLDKAPSLTVHPCPSYPQGTLVQRLLSHFSALTKLPGCRPGIVHRLDKDTSGLLLIALREDVRLALAEAFAQRQVRKSYLALVHGLPPESGKIDLPMGRHPSHKIKRAIMPLNQGGKEAHSRWRVLYANAEKKFSLVEVGISTGRTHQIRVHMAHVGYPLWGDFLYGKSDGVPRQMLHAWRLAFTHPDSGEEMSFTCPPPADFLHNIKNLLRQPRHLVLTGAPGCGKSTVLALFAEKGMPVWSADKVVADLYKQGKHGWHMLRQRFGSRFIHPQSQEVDKAVLTKAMVDDAVIRREIEHLIHPLVFHDLEDFFSQHPQGGVAEVPLWFESKTKLQGVLVLCVTSTRAIRWERLTQKRGWSQELCASADSWQWPEEDKAKAADFVLDNTHPLEALPKAVDAVLAAVDQKEELRLQEILDNLVQIFSGQKCDSSTEPSHT